MRVRLTGLLLAFTFSLIGTAGAQVTSTGDSLRAVADTSRVRVSVHTPEGALRRALILPGWGQIYNGDTWKAPLVYAGLAGTIGAALYFRGQHLDYRRANLYKESAERVASGLDPVFDDYLSFEPVYNAISPGGTTPSSTLKARRNTLRRNRDIMYLASVGVYGLSIIEAYIRAQMLDFDVSEDLSMSLRPQTEGVTVSLVYSF